jgi:hypothetical protein
MKSKPSSPLAPAPELGQRWPDLKLISLFLDLREIYEGLVRAQTREADKPSVSIEKAYRIICQMMERAVIELRPHRARQNGQGSERLALDSLVSELRSTYGGFHWLQSVASLLGMLMHLSWSKNGTPRLVNRRRPQRSFSSYPNSPAVGSFAGEAIVSQLFREPIPSVCNRASNAAKYAERALDFRILDPSMESGQLLLDIALACIRRVESRHSPTSKTGQRLIQALLKKLCADCLFGIDKNALALPAARLVFSLLGAEYGIERLVPYHLSTADSLSYFHREQFAEFDGVINNPPWGEVTNAAERRTLRKRFEAIDYWVDTYVPFSELGIRCLRPGGVLVLIIPSQVIAMRHAARLRGMFLSKMRLDQIILLPRAAFVDATVRAAMILGRAQETKVTSGMCHVIAYPFEKSIECVAPVRRFEVSLRALNRAGLASWAPLLNSNGAHGVKSPTVRLDRLADLESGMQVYVRNAGNPPQTAEVVRSHPFTFLRPAKGRVSVVRGRNVKNFRLDEPQQFVKFGKWLAWTGKHDNLRWTERIFVRELHRRDGKLTAAFSKPGIIPLKGVITVIPKAIDPFVLLGILNSAVAAQYVLQHGSSSSKVDFQRITIGELGVMPIPVAAIDSTYRRALDLSSCTKRDNQLRNRLKDLVRKLSKLPVLGDARRETLQAELDVVISEMYTLVKRKSDA